MVHFGSNRTPEQLFCKKINIFANTKRHKTN